MSEEHLVITEVKGLKFYTRHGSSDEKTLKEVIGKNAYARRGFDLESKSWLDLGANIGAFSVLAASKGATVRAYEPDPASFAILQMNVALNNLVDRVEIFQQAVVADDRKSVAFHVNSAKKNYWRNSTVKAWRGGYSLEVEAVHFKNVIRPGEDCKMDIEGAEMPILEALSKVPKRMVFEWSFDIDRSIPRFSKVISRLREKYESVVYSKFDESKPVWASEWFPPCRTVWCEGRK